LFSTFDFDQSSGMLVLNYIFNTGSR